jgi:phosphoserine phosphatase RsbU/P
MADLSIDDLDTAPAGFLVFSDEGIICKVNASFKKLLNCTEEHQLIGQNIETIFSMAGRIFYQTHFFPLLTLQGSADEIFFRLKPTRGPLIPVVCNAVRKIDHRGVALNHCLFLPVLQRSKFEQQLIDAKKEAQESLAQNRDLLAAKAALEENAFYLDQRIGELRKMNEDLLQFGKIISHDLQEPIRKIAVFVDKVSIEGQDQLDPAIVRQFKKINKECFTLRQLAANLERFISLSNYSENAAGIDLIEVIQRSFKMVASEEPAVSLFMPPAAFPLIVGFPKQLDMLFYHIFRNAIQYRRQNNPLIITVAQVVFQKNLYQEDKNRYRYADVIRISIIDNGAGFEQKDGENYFSIRKKDAGESFGLSFGLAFCKKITYNHRGEIAIRSTLGQGTAVVIELPLSVELFR